MGTFFSLGGGGVATLGWGDGGCIPPNSQKFRLRRAKKKKKGRWFLRKVFYYVEKIALPPPTPMSASTIGASVQVGIGPANFHLIGPDSGLGANNICTH
jgi:hypothetical protein